MQSAGPYQPGVPSFTPPLGAASGRRIRLPQSRQRGLVVDVLLALGLLVPVFFVTGYFTQILVYFLHLQASEVPQSIPTSLSTIDRALVFVAAAILAPIGEEFFFRGYATNAWARRLPWVRAFLQSALFFAFVHIIDVTGADASIALRAAILAFGARVPVSFALTWLYLHQHSIFASLALHAAYNGLLVLISFSLLAT